MCLLAVQHTMADSEIIVVAKGAQASSVSLALPDGKITAAGEKTATAGERTAAAGEKEIRLALKQPFSGYCMLEINRASKLLYIEDGATLTVTYSRDKSQPPYTFTGACAAENTYLAAHEYVRMTLPDGIGGTDAAKALNDSLQSCSEHLKAQSRLSATFIKNEGKRRQYAVLNAFYRKMGWNGSALPDVKQWMDELPQLWMAQTYRSFFLDALYAVGQRGGRETIHDYTKAELEYAQKMTDTTVRDAVLSHVMTIYLNSRGADGTDDLMPLFLSAVTNGEIRTDIAGSHSLWEKVRKGSRLPDFSFTDTEGKRVALSQFRGKYVLIDCWATWCGPCKIQLPHLEKVMDRYGDKNIVFIGISSDKNKAAWQKMVKDRHMRGVQLNEPDAEAEFFTLFRVNAIPRFILLSPDGTVYDAHLPRPSDAALTALLDTLLK